MSYIVTQVDTGKRQDAVKELLTMQGYDFGYSFENEDYICTVLTFERDQKVPSIVIREVKPDKAKDVFWHINQVAPNRKGSWARYIGEVIQVKNIQAVFESLSEANTNFLSKQTLSDTSQKWIETYPSVYTQNTIKYVQYTDKKQIHLESDKIYAEDENFLAEVVKIKQDQIEAEVYNLMQPLDHIATRVMSQDREVAILELVKLAPYYPWGAYNIEEQNSSTNPTRNIFKTEERYFPAKVFTAGNSPFTINFLEEIYNTTDIYAYNFGRSLHHLAFEMPDFGDGTDNIDKVVDYVCKLKPDMAGTLFGNREDGIRQIFMKRSRLFGWATEYVQRYDGYHGFFTRQNVANLTGALAEDEKL